MTCTIPPDGPCSITGDPNDCGIEKIYDDTIPPLETVFIQGANDSFTVTWDTATPYAAQVVRMLYREKGEGDYGNSPFSVGRDTGTISSESGLTTNDIYQVMLRPETATHYGDWQIYTAVIDDSWNSNSELVTHLGEDVVHNGEVVLIS